jgi:hypothetical protein
VIEGVVVFTPVAVTAMLNILLDLFSPVKLYKINSFHIGMQPIVPATGLIDWVKADGERFL